MNKNKRERERKRKRESVCVCERERERESRVRKKGIKKKLYNKINGEFFLLLYFIILYKSRHYQLLIVFAEHNIETLMLIICLREIIIYIFERQ
jgi:hypothetical protein